MLSSQVGHHRRLISNSIQRKHAAHHLHNNELISKCSTRYTSNFAAPIVCCFPIIFAAAGLLLLLLHVTPVDYWQAGETSDGAAKQNDQPNTG